jgi:hypothetical protein
VTGLRDLHHVRLIIFATPICLKAAMPHDLLRAGE